MNGKGAPEPSVLLFFYAIYAAWQRSDVYFISLPKNSSVAPYARIQLFHNRNP